MTEYAFDTTIYAVVRVKAVSEEEARALMTKHICLVDLSAAHIAPNVTMTEASLCDINKPNLFEVDGEDV